MKELWVKRIAQAWVLCKCTLPLDFSVLTCIFWPIGLPVLQLALPRRQLSRLFCFHRNMPSIIPRLTGSPY